MKIKLYRLVLALMFMGMAIFLTHSKPACAQVAGQLPVMAFHLDTTLENTAIGCTCGDHPTAKFPKCSVFYCDAQIPKPEKEYTSLTMIDLAHPEKDIEFDFKVR